MPSTSVDARKPSASAIAAQVTSRVRARGSALPTFDSTSRMPVATRRIPAWCSATSLVATPAAKRPTPGANAQKPAWARRVERTGVPSDTGRSWQSAPKTVIVSQPRVKRWVIPATCGERYAPPASSGATQRSPSAPASR